MEQIFVKTKIQNKMTYECQLHNYLFIISEIFIQWIVRRQKSKTKWPKHLLNNYLFKNLNKNLIH